MRTGTKAYLMLHLTTGRADGEVAILSDDNPSVRSHRERWVKLGEHSGRDLPDAFVGLLRRLRRNKSWSWAVDDLEAFRRPRVKLVRVR